MKTPFLQLRPRRSAEVILVAVFGLIPGAILCRAQDPRPSHDFQAWADLYESHTLNEKTDFEVSAGIRYGDDQGHLIYHRIASGLAFHWHRVFTIQPYYQYSVSDTIFGRQTSENRLALAITTATSWKDWEISDRNLGERRFIGSARDWRYRNRAELRRPVTVLGKQISVFAWDEVFYSSTLDKWYRNRVALGAGRRLSRKLSIDLYYVHQNDAYTRPGDLNSLGISIKTRF
ncbi:MAG TPA: DUF2490 domain-containing protein [Terriglobia bacterium]|nr:DUF2490 domain-containing protein [Terriglobia bacterium]